MLIGGWLVAQVAIGAGDDLPTEVRRLIHQLDAPQLAQREAAEAALLGRGPAVLPLLPPPDERTSAEVEQRLGRIRQKLQQSAADAVANASTITLRAEAMPLADILRAFQDQSDNTIVDYRQKFGQPATDSKQTIQFDKTPFWPALDRLLDQSGLTIYPYGQPDAISLIAALPKKSPARVGHASYSGPFRFEPIAVIARRDPREADGGTLTVTLEAAWEPRLRIITLLWPMADVRAVDEHGNLLPVTDRDAKPETSVTAEMSAVKFNLSLQLPPRQALKQVQRIASLHGKLLATLPGKTETFRFDRLADARNIERRIAGVTVTLDSVRNAVPGDGAKGRVWDVRIRVQFDDAGDALASHRQWIFGNPAYLEGSDRKPIAYDTYETVAQSRNALEIAYRFQTDRPLDALSFVYKTPGSIITTSYNYELKDIALP
jgi:hypothetical protein